jgi:hypothetical protein
MGSLSTSNDTKKHRLIAQIVMIERAIKSPCFVSSLLANRVDLAFGRVAWSSWIMLL